MGTTAEIVAQQFGITRQEQDEYAVRSHQRAAAAIAAGKFKDEVVPLKVRTMDNGKWKEFAFDTDEGPRADTTYEALAKLKPVFDPKGTVTAGNASQINDGAAHGGGHGRGQGQGAGPQAPGLRARLGGGRRAARDHGHRARRWPCPSS